MPYAIGHQIPVSKREEIFLESVEQGRWFLLLGIECLCRDTLILEFSKNELLVTNEERATCVTIVNFSRNLALSANCVV